MPQLQQLNLGSTKVTEKGVRNLLGLVNLKSFYAGDFPKEKAVEFAKIALEHRQKARAAGQTTGPDKLAPYAQALQSFPPRPLPKQK